LETGIKIHTKQMPFLFTEVISSSMIVYYWSLQLLCL